MSAEIDSERHFLHGHVRGQKNHTRVSPRMIPIIVFDSTCCAESHAVFITEPREACQFADSLLLICAGGTAPCCVSCRACYGTQGGRVVSVHNMVIVHRGSKVKDLKLVHKKRRLSKKLCEDVACKKNRQMHKQFTVKLDWFEQCCSENPFYNISNTLDTVLQMVLKTLPPLPLLIPILVYFALLFYIKRTTYAPFCVF